MNSSISLTALRFLLLIIIINSVYAYEEMRSDIYDLSQKDVVLDGATFSGFYYDIDDNSGTEKLTLRLQNISPDGSSATLSNHPNFVQAS